MVVDKVKQSLQIVRTAFTISDKCILFFSGGKDSVCCFNLLQELYSKNNIYLVFMAFVDGLTTEKEVKLIAADYGKEIKTVRHWSYFVDKAQGSYCMPSGKPKKLKDIYAEIRQEIGDYPIFYGAKKSDGLWRRTNTGNSKFLREVFAPIYEWSKYEVLQYIRAHKLKYIKAEGDRISGVDLSPKYLCWAYENDLESFEALRKEFPFIEIAVKRQEYRDRGEM